ncbi:MAG TPA: hypothetical protein VM221_13635 [Armatimonadota bacterium]|nr:hypothetical protein [Armatimonadota bacterium]
MTKWNDSLNVAQINALNQRGGRMLSVVDLLDAGTMDLDLASALCALVARGASFLSGAVPGGAGKTTIMAAILAFLPPDMEISTVDGERVIAGADSAGKPGARRCYLAHEIGAGHWYGYIWGRAVREYLDLARRGHMIATGLHADTLPQLRDILLSPPLGVEEDALATLGFTLFVAADRCGREVRRRVSAVHAGAAADAPALFRWDRRSDRFRREADLDAQVPPAERAALRELLGNLQRQQVRRIEDVRAAYLDSLLRS